jgi:hypothetical protein
VQTEHKNSISGATMTLIKSLQQYSTMGAEINQKPNIQQGRKQQKSFRL